jgi:hypothetical protein
VSVPLGVGANHGDRLGRRSMQFAPATPPSQRQAPNEGLKESNMFSRGAQHSSTADDRARQPIEQFTSRSKSLLNASSLRYDGFSFEHSLSF